MAISGGSVPTLKTVSVAFDAVVTESEARPLRWTITPTDGGQPAAIVRSALLPGGLGATLDVEPGLSPDKAYTVSLQSHGSLPLTAPDDAIPRPEEWPHPALDVVLEALGQEVQRFGGEGVTVTLRDFEPGDDVLFVESSLHLADAGAVFVGGRRLQYRSKGADGVTLRQVRVDVEDGLAIPYGSEVVADDRAYIAD